MKAYAEWKRSRKITLCSNSELFHFLSELPILSHVTKKQLKWLAKERVNYKFWGILKKDLYTKPISFVSVVGINFGIKCKCCGTVDYRLPDIARTGVKRNMTHFFFSELIRLKCFNPFRVKSIDPEHAYCLNVLSPLCTDCLASVRQGTRMDEKTIHKIKDWGHYYNKNFLSYVNTITKMRKIYEKS